MYFCILTAKLNNKKEEIKQLQKLMTNKQISKRIFTIRNEKIFNSIALHVFRYQYKNITIYRDFVDLIKRQYPQHYTQIPFLPISFFKTHQVARETTQFDTVFKSSGTTGQLRSQHFIENAELYIQSFETTYRNMIGNPEQQVILALLPNYIQQGESSLVFMVDYLIKKSESPLSHFILNEMDSIETVYNQALVEGKQVVVFGVSYALLDLAKKKISLPEAKIIETGGMKGRREEFTKEQLHQKLKNGLKVEQIFSEYGMTELLSQAYSTKGTWFETPQWMKVSIGDINDSLSEVEDLKTGRIRIIDLANVNSCSFIETEDLGKKDGERFQILGRIDHADIRGCNLLYNG